MSRLSREYELKKLTITTDDGDVIDIKSLVVDFSYHESIESAFVKCDFTILDSIDFNKGIFGGETIEVRLQTKSNKGKELKMLFRIYKIGSIIKSERGQIYVLHCTSPEMYKNECNRIFGAFGPGNKSKDKDNLAKFIAEKYLEADANRVKSKYFEECSRISFVSTSWRPTDVINFIADKVTRGNASKSSKKQSGFLFFENRNGFCFISIDAMCEGALTEEDYIYVHVRQGTEPPEDGKYVIESIQYPDKADHLRNMRMGTYKTVSLGVSLAQPTNSAITSNGSSNTKKSSPSGVKRGPRTLTFGQVFKKASTIEKKPPFDQPTEFQQSPENVPPTRMKLRVLPGLSKQPALGAAANNGTDSDNDALGVMEYAAARFSLLKAIQLTVVIPGNVGLAAGQLIQVSIPSSTEKGNKNPKVKQDKKFSGKYLIAGLTHIYKPSGVSTKLYLTRDSIKNPDY